MKERMKRKPFLQPCCLVLAQKKSKYYSSISCLGTGKVEILQYYLTACRAFVTRLRTEKSKYHNTISWHAAPLVAINKYKSQNLSLTKYFITTLLQIIIFYCYTYNFSNNDFYSRFSLLLDRIVK
jgi:hypothetical protein